LDVSPYNEQSPEKEAQELFDVLHSLVDTSTMVALKNIFNHNLQPSA
jgi:hypothetical protein